jgi:deoxycytidylate deaminase
MEPPDAVVNAAIRASTLSPCRSKRGAVVFDDDGVMAVGYNHKPAGFECDGSAECKAHCRIEALHAEQHALVNEAELVGSDMLHVKTVDGTLVPSGAPSCVECSKLILAAGIAGMWLYHADGWRRYELPEFHSLSIKASR